MVRGYRGELRGSKHVQRDAFYPTRSDVLSQFFSTNTRGIRLLAHGVFVFSRKDVKRGGLTCWPPLCCDRYDGSQTFLDSRRKCRWDPRSLPPSFRESRPGLFFPKIHPFVRHHKCGSSLAIYQTYQRVRLGFPRTMITLPHSKSPNTFTIIFVSNSFSFNSFSFVAFRFMSCIVSHGTTVV